MNKPNLVLSIGIVLTGLISFSALAHFPTLSCSKLNDKQLKCAAGFSDGQVPGKVELKVYDYDETLLAKYKTASDGSVKIPIPKGEFFIVFDPGHEAPAEFDYAELE